MKPTIRYIFLLGCIIAGTLATTISYAQVTAQFTATPKSGCEPLFVTFSNSSTGTGTLTYRWNFGNGNISTLEDPSQTFNSCGNYVVTLTVSNGSQSSTDTAHITVYCKPTANFTYDNSSGCPGTCVNFTNKATPGSGTIASTFWDFGDGDTSTAINPTHCYMSGGSYNVSLTVTNSFGCIITNVITNAITIYNPPVANFSGTPTSQCNAPATVSFSNFSTGTGKLTYSWNFGDPTSGGSNTSTSATPNHTYISSGNYTVILIVTDANGCKDTLAIPKYINIGSLTTSITTTPSNSGCCPLIVTFGETGSGNVTGYLWNFGGGIPNSTSQNPQIIFPCPAGSNPVVYNVFLTETFAGGCTATATTNVTVSNKPVANFSSNSTLSTCVVPDIVTFINSSTAGAGATYKWLFGDGDSSIATNPSHAYSGCGPYNVTLIATNQYGCSDIVKKTAFVAIICPEATFTATPIDGCIPKTVSFNSTGSTGNPIKWKWNFGDPSSGTADTSSLQNPTHIYSKPGCYDVTLYTTNASGCSDSVKIKDAVCVDKPPTPNFSATPTTTCAFNTVDFTSLSTGTDSLTTYLWKFGDGGTSTSENATHQYADTGYFNVTLIVCNAGCCDSIVFTNYIHILPPVAKISVTMDCSDPYNVCFNGTKSLGASTYDWNFGDPGSGANNTSTSSTPCHLYSSSGNYSISLTVYNSVTGCSYTKQTSINVEHVKAAFTFSPTGECVPDSVITVNNTIDGNSYQWIVTDSATGTVVFTSTLKAPVITFTNTGTYIFELIATDINGCSDTLISPIYLHANGVIANFSATPLTGCAPLKVQFTDLSTCTGGHIVSWDWHLGDPYTTLSNDTTVLQDPTHVYTKPGCYDIVFTAKSSAGCSQTKIASGYVCITTPATNFTVSDANGCVGNPVCFTSAVTGSTYSWNFGDPTSGANNTSGLANPCHTYNTSGLYTVSLKIVAASGCDSSITKTNYINITKPVANFGSSKNTSTCPPLLVNFTDSSHSNIASWNWNFGDGNNSSVQDPSHIYNAPGTYTVTLIVTNKAGCTDTIVKVNYVVVSGPTGTFSFTPGGGCAPLNVCFAANASASYTFIWNYGNTTSGKLPDGDSICYIYTVPGVYHPSLILQDTLGCTFAINSPDSILVDGSDAKFGIIDNPKCSPGIVDFVDSSYSLFGISSWSWNFGDPGSGVNDSSHLQNPSHNYSALGKYPVTLIIKTKDGCTNTYVDTLNVVPTPIALMDVLNNPVCPGGVISFRDSSTSAASPIISWSWNFGDPGSGALNTSTAQNTSHKYNKPGNYTVKLFITDKLGCSDSITNSITIWPLPAVVVSPNTKICDDTSTTLNASGGIIYLWTPSNTLSNDSINNPVATPTTTTTYIVSVTDTNGCQNSGSIVVTVNPLPVLKVSPSEKICLGLSTPLLATGGVSYNWSPSAGLSNNAISDPVANPIVTTTYTVTVTGSDGCKDKDSVLVKVNPLPLINSTPNQNICVGASATLGGSGGIAYAWSSIPAGFTSNSDSVVVTPIITTQYILTGTDTNGCSANDSTTVFVHPLPVVTVTNTVILCLGSSTQLNATGGVTYSWTPIASLSNPNISNPLANPADTTTYFVTVTNNFGCQAKDSVQVDVLSPFKAQVGPGDTICQGSSVQLDASGGIIYTWSPANSLSSATIDNPIASPTVNTIYTVIVSDGHCFSDTESVLVDVLPNPAFYAGKDQTVSAGQTVVLGQQSPTFTGIFSWMPPRGLSCGNCQNPVAKPDSTTTYVVTLTNPDGCKTTDSVTLNIICPEDVVFIPNAFTPNGDGLDDVFYVRSAGLRQFNYFRVFDRWGQLVFETNNLSVGWDGTYKGQKLPPAVYVYDFNGVCSTGADLDRKGNVTLIR